MSASAAAGARVTATYTSQPRVIDQSEADAILLAQHRSHREGPRHETRLARDAAPASLPQPAPTRPSTQVAASPLPGVATTGAATNVLNPGTGAAAGDMTIFRDSAIPDTGIAGAYDYASFTQEPSTDANGQNVFQTGNWYASRSFDNGASWQYMDPFTIFGGGFCCDQVTQYDAGRDRQWWLLQYGDHLALANSAGSDLFTNWCFYNITPSWIGLPNTASFDYNDLAIGTNAIYISTNVFGAPGGTGSALIRLPMDAMITCGGFSYNWVFRQDSFTFKPVQGATDVMYWGSNWGQTNGSSFRVYTWAENSGSYFLYDRTIDAFNFEYRNSGQNCGSADGVVTNWCQFADSRVLGGALSNGTLAFSFNVKQGSGFPFPYSRTVYFRQSDLAYTGTSSLWATWGAFQFQQLSPNARGHRASVVAWGGGASGGADYYPSAAVTIDDDFGSSISYHLWGAGNTCQYNGLWRWGDYLTVRPYKPAGDAWIASDYAIKGANCGATDPVTGVRLWFAEPHNLIFGRARDAGSVTRWWNS